MNTDQSSLHMEEIKQPTAFSKDEISMKDIILKMQDWWRYLLRRWIIIAIFCIVGAALGLTYALFQKNNYVGELSFVMEESKSSQLGAYAGIASQFGIDLGGGGSSGVFAGDNILEFLKSRLIIEKALLSPVVYNGKNISLADLYVIAYDLKEKWQDKPLLKELRYLPNTDRKQFSLQQDSVLNEIFQHIKKTNLIVSKPDKKLGFILVKCTTPNETLSKVFTERLVKEAVDFYIATKTMRSKTNVDKLQVKADSIELLLNKKTYSAAASQDLNLNPARRVAMVGTELASRDKAVLLTMYGEVMKNLELSRMAMSQETPLIQIVDTPVLPLGKMKFGKLKGLILGGFLGGLLIICILVLRRLYKSIMTS